MILNIAILIVGVVVVLWGADCLTEGAVGLAERMGISQMVIGLTIVAMGTSMPEFCVSLVSAIKGTPDLAVGNVVGSNVFNSMLIVGVAAMVAPMTIMRTTVKKDIPFSLVSSVVLLMLCHDGVIGRLDAGVLFAMFIAFMVITLRSAKVGAEEKPKDEKPKRSVGMDVFFLLLGFACLVLGSNAFVDSASKIAASLGVSEAVVGLTIVAGGTSLPELATSVVAARKGNSGIAIGNVLGSNVFNVLFILGATGLVCPMDLEGITAVDLSVMVIGMILLWFFSFTKYTIARWEGAVLTAVFSGYMWYLISNA